MENYTDKGPRGHPLFFERDTHLHTGCINGEFCALRRAVA